GIDSVVLVYLLNQLNFDISLAHCNFQLRGEDSDQDEKFVKKLAGQLQLPIFTRSFATTEFAKKEKLSIQLAARTLRYDWFNAIVKKNKLDHILTGHHADDSLETFLINMIRGTGLDGLTGIPERNENILRLLLPFTREQIEKYADENRIDWRNDSSNVETKYVRNKIRHDVIPVLKELNPSLLTSFNKTLQNLKGSRQIIKDSIENLKGMVIIPAEAGIWKIDIKKLKEFNKPQAYLYELLNDFGFKEWNDIADLLQAQSGKQIVSNTHRLVKDRDFLLLTDIGSTRIKKKEKIYEVSEKDRIVEIENFKIEVTYVKTVSIEGKTQNVAFIDRDKLKFPLIVRKWKNGDYFYPSGMQGKKKLSKFFIDNKMSVLQKEKIWLLCSSNEIIWVIGKRLDDRYKAIVTTQNILKIELK
ncbi:MAG: tRNA lysidine(34) synthetase TilS, partial [Aureibaculum sp.]|nr:tRNA lysidine(34) synthetase TilS [Aureibaculum sp.]